MLTTPAFAVSAPVSVSFGDAHLRLRMLLLHFSLCVVFAGMTLAVIMSSNRANVGNAFMSAVLGVAAVSSIALQALNPASRGLPGIFALLIACEIFAGLPGLIYWQSGDDLIIGSSFAILLAIRTYLLFWSLPASRSFLLGSFERIVLSWALVATTLFSFGSLIVARVAGITLGSSARLSGEVIGHWTNANTAGLYCAFGVLICIIARFIPLWIRLSSAGLAFYCLLLSQSRTAIITIIVSGICGLLIGRKWNWKVAMFAVCALLLALSLVDVDESFDSLQSSPAVTSITQRFLQPPGRNGQHARLDVIASGVEAWSRSPLFGLGYEAPETRFENGFLSLACETGAVGLLLYLVFVGLLSVRILRMLTAREEPETRELGRYLLCVTVFMLVHGMGERTHGFQVGSLVSNVWALLAASALGATLRTERSA